MTISNEQTYFGNEAPGNAIAELSPSNKKEQTHLRRYARLGAVALKGALLGPFRQVMEIGGEIKQAAQDYRTIKELDLSSDRSIRKKAGFTALKLWYAAPFPAYQIADDTVTYPLYLHISDQFNSGTAYGVAAGASMGLAASMGMGQRIAETKKAELMHVPIEKDTSDIVPPLLDASINSSPWQVARKANEPREEGEPIRLVGRDRVIAYAASYAIVNTGLYTAANQLPGNEWVGFGAMLAGVWSAGGAYRAVKEELNPHGDMELMNE